MNGNQFLSVIVKSIIIKFLSTHGNARFQHADDLM